MILQKAKKRILIIGGTRFIGLKILQKLQDQHEITVFFRGQSSFENPAGIKVMIGDRLNQDSVLDLEGPYDVIIDTCAYSPLDLKHTSQIQSEQYILISSVAVYSENVEPKSDEDGEKVLQKERWENVDVFSNHDLIRNLNYGELKYLTEITARKEIRHLLVLRPAIVLGPGDNSNRMNRIIQHSNATLQTFISPKMYFQYVDVRDIADFTALAIEKRLLGEFNLTSEPILWDKFFERIASISGYRLQFNSQVKDGKYPYFDPYGSPNIRRLSSVKALSIGWEPREIEDTLTSYLG